MIGRHVLSDVSIAPADEYNGCYEQLMVGLCLVYKMRSRETSIIGAAGC